MNRDLIFGELLGTMNVMSESFNDGVPTVSIKYMEDYSIKPRKFFEIIHRELIQHNHSFGKWENGLLDEITRLVDKMKQEYFTNEPLSPKYLLGYYRQQNKLHKKKNELQMLDDILESSDDIIDDLKD